MVHPLHPALRADRLQMPSQSQDYDLLPSSASVLGWFDHKMIRQNLKDVARRKLGYLADFDDTILSKMDPYFDPLKPFLRSLLVAAFPTRDYRYCQMSHETMIKLFDDQYRVLKRLEAEQEKKRADQNGRKANKMPLG
ncbi:hypothetical protein K443DRAFT_190326 [Laccaria amethystina LaAM-08-1]|uniref:Uncharacterized protein n=1 Tax=Laccaria amethystina LaAM-08-1 TaxID=1095629 RepID=A0A0C9XSU1_9AGAR|nr:hypothetical protein K443DRAFT_190326 [Laccaria amethystina LaAM-08-1]